MAVPTQYQVERVNPQLQQGIDDLPKRWPLVQAIESRDGTFTKDAQLVNCYAERNLRTGEYTLFKRIGFSTALHNHSPAGTGRGGFLWSSELGAGLYYIFGNKVYRNDGVIGTIIAGVTKHHFQLMDRSGTGKVIFGDGVNGYFTDGATVTQIVDVNFPTAFVPGWAYLDGTLYVMDFNCNILGSNLEDPSTWNALNVIQARDEPGSGVALTKHLTYVVALKQNSTEVFYDAGNATGSPLSRYEGGFSKYGCFLGESVQEIDGIHFWASSNNTISPQIVRMDRLQITPISTPPVERYLDNTDTSSAIMSWVFKHAGHRFYALTSVGSNYTIIYDIDQNLWYRWADYQGNNLDIMDMFPDNTVTGGRHLAQSRLSANIYIVDTCYLYPNDSGNVFPVDIYTPNFDAGVDRSKYLPVMRFTGDRVAGSTLLVRYNDYDYDPTKWSNFRQVNLGNQRPFLDNNGSFYRRALHLRHQQSLPFRISSVDLSLYLGTL